MIHFDLLDEREEIHFEDEGIRFLEHEVLLEDDLDDSKICFQGFEVEDDRGEDKTWNLISEIYFEICDDDREELAVHRNMTQDNKKQKNQ